MSDVFREVDEDVRQELYSKLWRAYGRYVIAGIVLVVVATAGTVLWREYTAEQRLVEGTRFERAIAEAESGQLASAAGSFAAIAGDSGPGYAALAQLRRAGALIGEGDDGAALVELETLAASGDAPEELRNIAILRAALLRLDLASSGSDDPALENLAESAGAWRPVAREILGLKLVARGDREKAIALFRDLQDDAAATPGIRMRAAQMLTSLENK